MENGRRSTSTCSISSADDREGARLRRSARAAAGTCDSKAAIHNYDKPLRRYVIAHEQLFLGHFNYVPRFRRKVITLTRESALGNFEERLEPLSEANAMAEARRCMSCGQCFESTTASSTSADGRRAVRRRSHDGPYVYTDYDKCIGCHICADVCPTVTSRWAGE